MGNRDASYLFDMLLAARRIEDRTKGRGPEDREADLTLRETLYWQIGVIGKAATHLSEGFREQHPDTPWHQVVGIRNRLIHGYREINNAVVWDVVETHLPTLIAFLSRHVQDRPDAD